MIANARMYGVNPRVTASWERLLAWIGEHAGVPLEALAHPHARPLAELWRRDDLGCVFMCGYPWSIAPAAGRPRLLGSPRPSPARYGGRAVYCTDIVVHSDSAFTDIASLHGARFAYTLESSQSGWQAPRALFATHALAAGGRWFRDVVGPLETPRAVVDAVVAGRVDAGPLDGYWHDLLDRHEPATAALLRTVVSTPMTPIPALVCSAATPDAIRARLVEALAGVAIDPALSGVRDDLLVLGFGMPAEDAYAGLAQRARQVDGLGYPRLR
jgi:ABC-type phosphate/phosphonate transport system substrate-binding protein